MSTAPLEQRRSRARLAFALLALFLPLQILAMHWPLPKMPLGAWRIWDKAPHFIVYTVFASLLVWYVVAQRRVLGKSNARGLARSFSMAFVCVASYAWLDELTQPFTGRSCDVYDWLADILGAGLVFVGAYIWRRCRGVAIETPMSAEFGRVRV
ncbi:MAG: VanZ family protein [Planctomycetia bacterium]|nr:VanZ family protein [Planctomycetia bacterium]